jgi:thioredoxin reductase (NADPH)
MSRGEGALIGRHDLLVVGAGPVGIAALWFARRHGLDAVAVDAGTGPLSCIRGFLPGLVTVSGARDWEIDGLPVDCHGAREVTREDLLGYYARVARYGRMRIADRSEVIAIVPDDEGVRVTVRTSRGHGWYRARRVLVTPWFRKRPLQLSGAGISVLDAVPDPMAMVGQDVVIVGAGLSGLEAADLLLRAGARVTILARGGPVTLPAVPDLIELSGSRVLERVTSVAVARPGVLAVVHDGGTTEVPCTVAINCTGHEPNRPLIAALRAGGLLSDEEHEALARFRQSSAPSGLEALAKSLPNLSDALWRGRRGVHFAGTAYHVGGVTGAGIVYSIETAKWAVGAMAGVGYPDAPTSSSHLPAWFVSQLGVRGFPARGPRWSEHLARIVPVPVPTWSRGTCVLSREDAAGTLSPVLSRETRALGDARGPALTRLRAACFGHHSVGELRARLGVEPNDLLRALHVLWQNNGLTWVPPVD